MSAGISAAVGIRLDRLTLGYGGEVTLRELSGTFAPGSLTAVIGPNGAGKSTLLKAVAGLLKPRAGSIEPVSAGGQGAGRQWRRLIGYLPQQAEIDLDFPMSVLDTVLMGAWRRIGGFGGASDGLLQEAEAVLERFGLGALASRPLGALSPGLRQRAFFARLMLLDAPVLLLDEPFAALDAATSAALMDVIAGWHGEGRTIITVLHDLELARTRFADTLRLAPDAVTWGRTAGAPGPKPAVSAPLAGLCGLAGRVA
ncbi:metal ABC transporter ATP-binding protein [Radicibacter daui]|uniref:metal ABC transporter ATP-binding protein n=1 Tax=Radicibacter daui TaxID=3064829 RepID=UPI004046D72A